MQKKLILLGLAAFLLTGCGTKKAAVKTEDTQNKEFSGTLQQAMKLGMPVKCEWKQNEDTGTSYVKGTNVYMEMTTQGKTGYVIWKDGCTWTWGQEQPQGTKICLDTTKPQESAGPQNTADFKAQGVNANVEYKCNPTLISDDKFNPPANIQFTDLQDMMKGLVIPSVPPIPSVAPEE